MPDEIKLPERRGVTVKSVIYGVLGLQLVLAVLLMGGDLWRALPSIGMPSTQPRFDQPVNPGDQTRRYRPADMPLSPRATAILRAPLRRRAICRRGWCLTRNTVC